MLKQYEISVLVIEPDEHKRAEIEKILEYVGLSGQDVRDIASSEQEGLNCLNRKNYNLILGSIPSGAILPPEQVHVEIPKSLDEKEYLNFLSSLTKQLEEKFCFNYDYH